MNQMKRLFLIVVGCISLALGTAGIVLPILPTAPSACTTGLLPPPFIKSISALISSAAA